MKHTIAKIQSRCLKFITNSQGFTLVELMIVVAIIGILASIAIPNYQKFQAKARQAEAKLTLSGVYTAEKSYSVEATTYSTCFQGIGFAREGKQAFYSVGFQAAGSGCGPEATTACDVLWSGGQSSTCPAISDPNQVSNFLFIATQGAGAVRTSGVTDALFTGAAALSCTAYQFRAGAEGQIGKSTAGVGVHDIWTVDHDKNVANVNPGAAL